MPYKDIFPRISFSSTLLMVLLMIFIALQNRLWIGNGSFSEVNNLVSRIKDQRIKNKALFDSNNLLNSKIAELSSGMALIEERARYDLGMIKKDETLYQISQ